MEPVIHHHQPNTLPFGGSGSPRNSPKLTPAASSTAPAPESLPGGPQTLQSSAQEQDQILRMRAIAATKRQQRRSPGVVSLTPELESPRTMNFSASAAQWRQSQEPATTAPLL